MASTQPVDIILGTHQIGDTAAMPGVVHYDDAPAVLALLDAFHARGHRQLDTSRNYGGSEVRLGAAGAPARFVIHTKIGGMGPHTHGAGQVRASINASLKDLGVEKVRTMLLHVPDRETEFEETAGAMQEAWREGKFERWGLSNYKVEEVERFLTICQEKGWEKPSVYEGHYNAVVRGGEKELFPLLRKHRMAFFAYSAAAGGLFANTPTSTMRWSKENPVGKLYSHSYGHSSVHKSVSIVQEAAHKYGIDGHAAVLRWARFHGALSAEYGDAVLFGASRIEQLHQTLDALEAGPLPTELAEVISGIYKGFERNGEPDYHL